VSAKEDAQDIKISEEMTSDAQDTSNYPQLIHAKLGKIVCETLLKSEGEGFLYVFRDPKHKGAVKIGYTRDINRRTKEHGKCDLELIFVHISGRVKAMKRAEQLIKADLRHLRRPWDCPACKRTHEEWFEIDEETAKARVTLWVNWINNCDPYDPYGYIKPLWRYLIEYGRNPREELDSRNHEARWKHWNWVLSEPLPSDMPGFQKHQRRSSGMSRRPMPSHRHGGQQIAPTHNQIITHVDRTSIEALQTLGINEFLHAATQTATNNNINWTLSINVQCDAHGNQRNPSIDGSSWE
jgi:predicted GIY-YIG superfamily endonuclease